MKKLLFLLGIALVFLSFKTENKGGYVFEKQISTFETKEGWRYPTQAEVDDMVNKGWLKEDDDPQYLVNCQWADGFGGQLSCNGICRLYTTNNGVTWRIGCFNGDVITSNCCERS